MRGNEPSEMKQLDIQNGGSSTSAYSRLAFETSRDSVAFNSVEVSTSHNDSNHHSLNTCHLFESSDSSSGSSGSSVSSARKETYYSLSKTFPEALPSSDSLDRAVRKYGFLPWRQLVSKLSSKIIKESVPAWFFGILGGFVVALLVLCANVSVLVWVRTRFKVVHGTAAVFTGSCSRASTITTWVELAINVLSTVLLAANCNCSQLLVSLTRSEIEKAHLHGRWVHVGVASLRNFGYNSVVFSSSYTADFITALVTESFERGAWWNETYALASFAANSSQYGDVPKDGNSAQIPVTTLKSLQSSIHNFTKLENDECEDTFGSRSLNLPYLNVLLVTNYTTNNSFVDGSIHYPERGMNDIPWFNATGKPLPPSYAAWTSVNMFDVPVPPHDPNPYTYSHGEYWNLPVSKCNTTTCFAEPAWIQYCLAQPVADLQTRCTISVSTNLLVAVIVCNCIKAICLAIFLAPDFHPLATVGDAIESFMNRPDPLTLNCGPVSMFQLLQISSNDAGMFGTIGGRDSFTSFKDFFRKQKYLSLDIEAISSTARVWGHNPRTWSSSLSSPFPHYALLFCGAVYVMILSISVKNWGGGLFWSRSKTLSGYHSAFATSFLQPLTTNALLINAPQLAVSIAYMLYTTMLTTIGVYLTNVQVYNIAGQEVPSRHRLSYDTSGLPLLFAFLLGTCFVALFAVFMRRKFGTGMPIIGTCSLAITKLVQLVTL
ncbi:uncharacterized protein LY89DRAFT_742454 [Mollisia scopiformis]|uniref:DUF6536 domain-containing protein n=1 Tax=Mollisia scopiformis TaxID=149040 RepID=A0A132B728_MOLSC|nr:uncharacterized protein LY89DRAFT_742454 [Mollisia scopiformis]KUJ07684.1 hypothetical protein LY89DRAFT_742454 [Mollisia scopiformis]